MGALDIKARASVLPLLQYFILLAQSDSGYAHFLRAYDKRSNRLPENPRRHKRQRK